MIIYKEYQKTVFRQNILDRDNIIYFKTNKCFNRNIL